MHPEKGVEWYRGRREMGRKSLRSWEKEAHTRIEKWKGIGTRRWGNGDKEADILLYRE